MPKSQPKNPIDIIRDRVIAMLVRLGNRFGHELNWVVVDHDECRLPVPAWTPRGSDDAFDAIGAEAFPDVCAAMEIALASMIEHELNPDALQEVLTVESEASFPLGGKQFDLVCSALAWTEIAPATLYDRAYDRIRCVNEWDGDRIQRPDLFPLPEEVIVPVKRDDEDILRLRFSHICYLACRIAASACCDDEETRCEEIGPDRLDRLRREFDCWRDALDC